MQRFYHSLSEKDRRRYAAVEALKLGRGGLSCYIGQLLECDDEAMQLGKRELEQQDGLTEILHQFQQGVAKEGKI